MTLLEIFPSGKFPLENLKTRINPYSWEAQPIINWLSTLVPSLSFLISPSFCSFTPLPFPPFLSFPSLPVVSLLSLVNPARGPRERCELPRGVRGRALAVNTIWHIFRSKKCVCWLSHKWQFFSRFMTNVKQNLLFSELMPRHGNESA